MGQVCAWCSGGRVMIKTSIERKTNEESPVWDLLFELPPWPVSKDDLWQEGDPANPMKPTDESRAGRSMRPAMRLRSRRGG